MRKQNKETEITNEIVIRAYTLSQLARYYSVDRKTFRKWLKPFHHLIGERVGNYYNVKQVQIIFECIEPPFKIKMPEDFEELKEAKEKKRKVRIYAKVHNIGKHMKGIDSSFPNDF